MPGRQDSSHAPTLSSRTKLNSAACGLIKNSLSVRNPFEIYGPFRKITKQILNEDSALILTYEWDFVPFTIPQTMPALPKYVIIGLPASEASNSLIIPSAAHELGHSVWNFESVSTQIAEKITLKVPEFIRTRYWDEFQKIYPKIEKSDLDGILGKPLLAQAYEWAESQIEEVFCDAFGLIMFGPAYTYAFRYLLAPGIEGKRHPYYPGNRDRAEYILSISQKFGIPTAEHFVDSFIPTKSPFQSRMSEELMLKVVDEVVYDSLDHIATEAKRYLDARDVVPPLGEVGEMSEQYFNLGVPTPEPKSIVDIVNAGWRAFFSPDFLGGRPTVERVQALNDLILKSAEVLEVREQLG